MLTASAIVDALSVELVPYVRHQESVSLALFACHPHSLWWLHFRSEEMSEEKAVC